MPLWGQFFRGVNVAGAEFGEGTIPGRFGREYTYNSPATFQYFAAQGLNLFRIPVRWERLQPQLRGPLDTANLGYLKQNVEWAKAAGGRIIIDIHNYGRYKINEDGKLNEYAIDNTYGGAVRVSTADFIDFWVRMSSEFKGEAGVYAYALMNEPHDMGAGNWKSTSQAVVDAIRANGDDTLILVPGDSWSSANRWARTHGPSAWIGDPANHFAYEAHLYFDQDESGTYKNGYDAATPEIGVTRLRPFLDWCRANGVRGFLGEYGVPAGEPRWHAVLEKFLGALDEAGFSGTYWAAGEWWGSYALSVQPGGGADKPQLAILRNHPGAGFLANTSAASGALYAAAPGALVSAYGLGIPTGGSVELVTASGARLAVETLYTSATQINLLVPEEAPLGWADVVVSDQGKVAVSGSLKVERVAPGLFLPAQLLRIKPDGSRAMETITGPIDFSADRLFLILYATGVRGAAGVRLEIGGQELPVLYAGTQGEYLGLDQVNAELPRTLAGAGEVRLLLNADGKSSNALSLAFR